MLEKIFREPYEELSLFTEEEIDKLNNLIYEKDGKCFLKSNSKNEEEKQVYSEKKSAPEEVVRQLFLNRLTMKYRYPKDLIEIEKVVSFGKQKKRADVVIYKDDKITPFIVVEVKAPDINNDIDQLKSYLNAEGAQIGIAVNGQVDEILYRPYPKDFSTLPDIPEYGETPEDVFNKKYTYKDLKEPLKLKKIIQQLENIVLANSGYDSFDELFKIFYAKLYDEITGREDENYVLNFVAKHDENTTKNIINDLFEKAKNEWKDIFDESDKIKLKASSIKDIVSDLQEYRLLGSNLKVMDDAFEYLITDVSKGKKGQYFTPRHVIDMCVRMLKPKKDEYVIDTACGSGGFLIHTMNYVKKDVKNISKYAGRYLWGIDFDERTSKISKAMMLIAGDGKTHIFKEDSLNSSSWSNNIKVAFDNERLAYENYKYFKFDVLLANPPFAGEVKDEVILAEYPNVVKEKQKKISRHLLFIERNLNFVKSGGRLAIVLPQGVFNNSSEKYVREFLIDKARILAVVGLDVNTFKPHTGVKTSVLFLQKWDEKINPRKNNYDIFFAVSEQSGKDNSGEYIYEEVDGKQVLKHDLFEIADEFDRFVEMEGIRFGDDDDSK